MVCGNKFIELYDTCTVFFQNLLPVNSSFCYFYAVSSYLLCMLCLVSCSNVTVSGMRLGNSEGIIEVRKRSKRMAKVLSLHEQHRRTLRSRNSAK